MQKIITKIADELEVDLELVFSKSRKKEAVQVRRIYCHVAYFAKGHTYKRIANDLGRLNHTSILHHCRTDLTKEEKRIYDCVKNLKRMRHHNVKF